MTVVLTELMAVPSLWVKVPLVGRTVTLYVSVAPSGSVPSRVMFNELSSSVDLLELDAVGDSSTLFTVIVTVAAEERLLPSDTFTLRL